MLYIKDFYDGLHVLGHYFVQKREERESRAGKPFLSLMLQDKTGRMDAKIWEIASNIEDFAEGDMIKIDARVVSFQGALQVKIGRARRSMPNEFDPADYVLSSPHDIGLMFDALLATIETVECEHIRCLLRNIFTGDLHSRIKTQAAAMHMHHAYVGGFLEHTLSVVKICEATAPLYRCMNRDILLAGAMLHDIGKLHELSPPPSTAYTDDGQMLGHITLGALLVAEYAAKVPQLSHEKISLITHCILAHHGEYEFGSPKLPMTMEAMLIHFADNIDAKLTTFQDTIEQDKTDSLWTGYQKSLGRYVRKP